MMTNTQWLCFSIIPSVSYCGFTSSVYWRISKSFGFTSTYSSANVCRTLCILEIVKLFKGFSFIISLQKLAKVLICWVVNVLQLLHEYCPKCNHRNYHSFLVSGKIRTAIGKAQLLLTKRFKQFKELCHDNIVSLMLRCYSYKHCFH